MINELLVLGRVPGTNFQITFSEMVATACILYLMHKYIQYAIEIHRWYKWICYRTGVNYRLRKRLIRSFIKYKRYRLALFERRLIRQVKRYLRHRRHDLFMITVYRPYSSLKRHYWIKLMQMERTERRIKRQIKSTRLFQGLMLLRELVRPSV